MSLQINNLKISPTHPLSSFITERLGLFETLQKEYAQKVSLIPKTPITPNSGQIVDGISNETNPKYLVLKYFPVLSNLISK